MGIGSQYFSENIRQVVARCHEDKADHLTGNLLAKSGHLHTEVPVAASYDVVVDHRDAGLIVFEEL